MTDINASVSILHNAFGEDGKVSNEKKKLTETDSSQNDEKTTQRWSGKSLRLMLRRKPDGAEDLLETRVAVVGNVVSLDFESEYSSSRIRASCLILFPLTCCAGRW